MQKLRLLRGLINGRTAFGGPYFIELDVTNRCNMNCLGCQYHSSKSRGFSAGRVDTGDIDPIMVDRLGKQLSRLHTREVILTGEGEPMLHPHLFEMITSLKKNGLLVQLFTNGTLIDQKAAAAVLETGVDVLKVSLWASTAEEYARCYPGVNPGNFEKTKTGIRTVTRSKSDMRTKTPQIIITGPLNRFNYRGIDSKIDLALELGCDGIAFNPYKHWSGEFIEAALNTDEIEDLSQGLLIHKKRLTAAGLSHNIDDLLLQYRLKEDSWNTMPCFAGWYGARVRADGEVMPCCRCYLPLGNVHNAGFEKIWNSRAYHDFRAAAVQRERLASMQGICACQWCIWAINNYQTYRLIRKIAPRYTTGYN